MTTNETEAVAFAKPGGETCGAARARPIDLAHLSRQTLGDHGVEEEVLSLFMHQMTTVHEKICSAEADERRKFAHGLKGSALGVGAFIRRHGRQRYLERYGYRCSSRRYRSDQLHHR